ncbi:MAG: ATP-binding protein [Verrucomicrobiota bacterium]
MTETPDSIPSAADANRTREAVRREMLRTNTFVGVVIVIVLLLTLAVVITGARAKRGEQRAENAEAASTERLWNAYLAQASALRLTANAGRRAQALQVVSNAAAIKPALELRSEAAATLALADLIQDQKTVGLPRGMDSAEMDSSLEHFSYGDANGRVVIASVQTGANLFTLEPPAAGAGLKMVARSTAFSPDGKFLTARYAGGSLVTWEIASRDAILVNAPDATNLVIAGMSYSSDSKRLMFSDGERDRQITVFDLEKRERLSTGVRTGAKTFRFRPGTAQVGVASDGIVTLMEHPDGTVVKTLPHPTRIYLISWSPNGVQLAVACEDGDVYLWDVEGGTHRILRGHSEPVIRIGFSPDNRLVFTGSRDGTTRLWDAETGLLIMATEQSVAHSFSTDGKRIGFWQLSKALGTWRLDESDCYTSLRCPKSEGAFAGLDLSPDGRWVVATQTKGIRVWEVNAGYRESFFPVANLMSARVAADSKGLFVCTSNALERWPIRPESLQGAPLEFGKPQAITLPDNLGARNISVALDGSAAAVELADFRLCVIDLVSNREPVVFPEKFRGLTQKGSASPTGPGRFAMSPDGRWVCTGYWFGPKDLPRVWDARTAQVIATPHMDTALATFSADGRWLGFSGVSEFQIYSTADWSRVAKFKRDESSFTHGVLAFSTKGQVVVSRTRQVLQVRDVATEEKYIDLVAPVAQSVASLRISLDGKVLATGSARDVIQVWRLDRLRAELEPLKLDWGAGAVASATQAAAVPSWFQRHALLTFGGAGFGLATLVSLFALRRHRAAIERFFIAEAKTAEQNRALEAAKMELMQSQKMQALGTLAAGIAHDFNNLLSVIRMSNKLIGRATKQDPDVQENVADIEQAVVQGKNVVGSMLGYARSENDSTGPLEVSSAVEETVSLLSKEFLSGIALTLELDRHAPAVNISRGQVEQVLLNLVVNASEAMQGRGKLKISVHPRTGLPDRNFVLRPEPSEKFVELSVADSGPGISAEIRDRLFEPFFTTKRGGAKAGTGLGLSLVYSIAEQERLGLNVDGEPGKGAVFTIYFPVKSQ